MPESRTDSDAIEGLHDANRLALEAGAVAREGMDGVGEAVAGTLAMLEAVDQIRETGMVLNATLSAAVIAILKRRPEEGMRALQLARQEADAAIDRYERLVAAGTAYDGGD